MTYNLLCPPGGQAMDPDHGNIIIMKPNLDCLTGGDISNIIRRSGFKKLNSPPRPFLLEVRRKIMRNIIRRLQPLQTNAGNGAWPGDPNKKGGVEVFKCGPPPALCS